jgi:hypothetical protein
LVFLIQAARHPLAGAGQWEQNTATMLATDILKIAIVLACLYLIFFESKEDTPKN